SLPMPGTQKLAGRQRLTGRLGRRRRPRSWVGISRRSIGSNFRRWRRRIRRLVRNYPRPVDEIRARDHLLWLTHREPPSPSIHYTSEIHVTLSSRTPCRPAVASL